MNDFNRCGTPNKPGRGRRLRALPKKDDIIDAPANGARVGEHDAPYSPRRAKPRPAIRRVQKRSEALAKAKRRDTRGKPTENTVSGTYAAAADKTREAIADHAARCRLAKRLAAAQ